MLCPEFDRRGNRFECNLNRILQWTSRTKGLLQGLLQCALSDTQSYSSCIQMHHGWKPQKQAHSTLSLPYNKNTKRLIRLPNLITNITKLTSLTQLQH